MALFGGKGLANWLLAICAAMWTYEVVVVHAPQMLEAYPNDTYQSGVGLTLKMNQSRWWITAHAVGASIVYFMWLLQCSQDVRQWSYTFHRWNGRVSVIVWLSVGILTPIYAFRMSQVGKRPELITSILIASFGVLVILWLVVGWLAIAKWKDKGFHRQCMVRVVLNSTFFIIGSRLWALMWYDEANPWWFDHSIWSFLPIVVAVCELVPYVMELSFETPWEFRLFGFVKLWDQPKAADMEVDLAVAQEAQES